MKLVEIEIKPKYICARFESESFQKTVIQLVDKKGRYPKNSDEELENLLLKKHFEK